MRTNCQTGSFTQRNSDHENNKEDLRLDFENDNADQIYQILRLKEKELWIKEKGGDDELHLIPK